MIKVSMIWYLFGLLAFLILAAFDFNYWVWAYYLWDKGKDLIFMITLLTVVSKQYQFMVKCMLFYSAVRFVWEIISALTGIPIGNSLATSVLFIVLIVIVIATIIYDHTIKHKKRSGF